MIDNLESVNDDQMHHSTQMINQYDDRNLRKFLSGQKNIFKQDKASSTLGVVDLLFNLFTSLVDMTLMLSNNSNKTSQMEKTQIMQAKSLFHKKIASFLSYYSISTYQSHREIVQIASFTINSSIKNKVIQFQDEIDKDNEKVRRDIANSCIIDKIKLKLKTQRLSNANLISKEKERNRDKDSSSVSPSKFNRSPMYTPITTESNPQQKKTSKLAKTSSFGSIGNNPKNHIEYCPITTDWQNQTGEKIKSIKELKPTVYTRNLITKYQKVIDNYDQVLTLTDSNKRKLSQNSINNTNNY